MHAARWRTELSRLLDTPLAVHRNEILKQNRSMQAILKGQCPVVLYPAGRMATTAAALLHSRGVSIRGLCDTNPARWGQTIRGLPVVCPQQVAEWGGAVAVLVASSLHDSAIREFLATLGCPNVYSMPYLNHCLPDVFISREYARMTEAPFLPGASENIIRLFDLLADDASRAVLANKIRYYLTLDKQLVDDIQSSDPIYFDTAVFSSSPNEIILDGGAFNGDTLRQFRHSEDVKFRHYYAFEPDPVAFEQLRLTAAVDSERITCIRAGLSDRTGTLFFSATGAVDSAVVETDGQATESIPVVDLDTFFAEAPPPTLIKLDIEGSERSALAGSRRLIDTHRPLLAVSAYHFPKDLWEIPLLLAHLNAGARIYLRHYTREIDDTVCYAVPVNRSTTASP